MATSRSKKGGQQTTGRNPYTGARYQGPTGPGFQTGDEALAAQRQDQASKSGWTNGGDFLNYVPVLGSIDQATDHAASGDAGGALTTLGREAVAPGYAASYNTAVAAGVP